MGKIASVRLLLSVSQAAFIQILTSLFYHPKHGERRTGSNNRVRDRKSEALWQRKRKRDQIKLLQEDDSEYHTRSLQRYKADENTSGKLMSVIMEREIEMDERIPWKRGGKGGSNTTHEEMSNWNKIDLLFLSRQEQRQDFLCPLSLYFLQQEHGEQVVEWFVGTNLHLSKGSQVEKEQSMMMTRLSRRVFLFSSSFHLQVSTTNLIIGEMHAWFCSVDYFVERRRSILQDLFDVAFHSSL